MKSLFYLTSRTWKNKFSELIRSPLRLIVTVGFIALLIMNFSADIFHSYGQRPLEEFYAIIFLFYALAFLTGAYRGFTHGGSVFSLTDVNFLFTSPLKPSSVLFHGMMNQLGSSLWMGLVFVYQFALLRSLYPVGTKEMLLCVLGYGAVVFLSQTAAMLFYFFTCGEEEKIKKAKAVFYLVCLVFLLIFLSGVDFYSFSLLSLAKGFISPVMGAFPVAGWIFALVKGVFEGNYTQCIIAFSASAVFVASVFLVLSRSAHGYYEDVLLTAEKNAADKASGNVGKDKKSFSEVKGGIGKGKGASVVFYKHLLENRRTKTSLFTQGSAFYIVLIVVYALVFKTDAISLFAMSCTASIITVIGGRWVKELTLPYIYLIPGRSVKKLFFLLPEMLPKVLTESAVHSALIAVLCKLGARMIPAFFAARVSFCFVVMASALLTARIFREKEKNNIFAATAMAASLAFSLPSVAVFMSVASFGFGTFIGLIMMSAINIIVGTVVLFFARKLLSFAS